MLIVIKLMKYVYETASHCSKRRIKHRLLEHRPSIEHLEEYLFSLV